ncbi:MAG TPA: ribbon-helix-helix domain-containing protein [Xanthobacteraceae bacterium]|jgi:predicted DNA-binding ribbon-helix-helix protein|nr:ribbon-helix-helix domain-containing protein [Xanthobacteraceae bacterium]
MKHSIVIDGHKTSISIEEPFWNGLRGIAVAKGTTVSKLVSSIDNGRQQGNLSSHIRLFVLEYYQGQAAVLNATEQVASSTTVAASK